MVIFICSISLTSLISNKVIDINKETIILHQKPSTDAKVNAKLNNVKKAHVLSETDYWYNIRIDNKNQGWVAKWYLENKDIMYENDISALTNDNLKFYQSPDTNSKVIRNIPKDTYLAVTKESDGWTRINYKNMSGYVETKFVSFLPTSQAETNSNDYKDNEDLVGNVQIGNNENTVYMRSAQSLFIDQPSINGNIIYAPEYNQAFEFIEEVDDEQGNTYYLVKDKNGTKGYIEARVAAFAKDYEGHSTETSAKSLADATILLDPGHGGEDPGALSNITPEMEKTLNLKTTLVIKKKLEERGATVLLTRDSDTWVDLDKRAKLSNDKKVDAFISIHYDYSPDPSWNGVTTYYFHEDDYNLANSVSSQLTNLKMNNQGTAFGNYQVLRENHRPSLLVELGYMSNQNDLSFITKDAYYNQVAEYIANGLDNYFINKP